MTNNRGSKLNYPLPYKLTASKTLNCRKQTYPRYDKQSRKQIKLSATLQIERKQSQIPNYNVSAAFQKRKQLH